MNGNNYSHQSLQTIGVNSQNCYPILSVELTTMECGASLEWPDKFEGIRHKSNNNNHIFVFVLHKLELNMECVIVNA